MTRSRSAGNGGGQIPCGAPYVPVAPLSAVLDQIRSWHRKRCFAMECRKRNDLALGAFLRTALGWSRNLPEGDRKRIAAQAASLISDPRGSEFEQIVTAALAMNAPMEAQEKQALKEMTALAELLPVWPSFGEPIRGFGAGSLAVIVAEAGDLSAYANPGKLWKRMGLAVMGDVRQGGLSKSASKDEWIAHGYNRQRRSRMWNIGDALIKGNRDGEYRAIYLARKAYEIARDPDIKPIKAHRRAQRYMEKRLLRNLWQAWRRASHSLTSDYAAPGADSIGQADRAVSTVDQSSAERSAVLHAPPNVCLPSATTRRTRERVKPIATQSDNKRADALAAPEACLPAKRSAKAHTPTTSGLPGASVSAQAGKRRAVRMLSTAHGQPAADITGALP